MASPSVLPRARTTSRHPLHVFRSEGKPGLHAFAGEEKGEALPAQVGPWVHTGTISPQVTRPHGLSRLAIEDGITATGYQLFRQKSA
jgi:hypothetical protein